MPEPRAGAGTRFLNSLITSSNSRSTTSRFPCRWPTPVLPASARRLPLRQSMCGCPAVCVEPLPQHLADFRQGHFAHHRSSSNWFHSTATCKLARSAATPVIINSTVAFAASASRSASCAAKDASEYGGDHFFARPRRAAPHDFDDARVARPQLMTLFVGDDHFEGKFVRSGVSLEGLGVHEQ